MCTKIWQSFGANLRGKDEEDGADLTTDRRRWDIDLEQERFGMITHLAKYISACFLNRRSIRRGQPESAAMNNYQVPIGLL